MLPSGKGYIKLPLPWGYNVLHVTGQAIGEVLTRKNNNHVKSALRIAAATIGAFNPVGGESSISQLVSPTVWDPFVQWGENKDWAGRKLRPDNNPFAEKPLSQLYWSSARKPSKIIARKLNEWTGGDAVRPGWADISPEAIDLFVDTFMGGMGRFAGDMISTPLKMAKKEDVETYEIPMVRKVYERLGMMSVTQDFYENLDSVRMVKRQLDHYETDRKKTRSIRRQFSREVRLIGFADEVKQQLSELYKERRRVDKIKSRALREKRKRQINNKIERIMRRFSQKYNKVVNKN
jgi:hypothetical protein